MQKAKTFFPLRCKTGILDSDRELSIIGHDVNTKRGESGPSGDVKGGEINY